MKDGMIQKTAKVGALTATEDELKKINAYTLEPLKEEDVYLFKIAVVSNAPEIDRDYEPLTQKAVESLAAQLKGKTIIFDHNPSAQNQKARIYDTVCEQNGENGRESASDQRQSGDRSADRQQTPRADSPQDQAACRSGNRRTEREDGRDEPAVA